jgi:hypothetical protein
VNKVILRGSIFSGLIGITLWASMAASVGSQSTVLEVVVPDTATVVRKQRNPLTGRLTAFGETKLTLEAGGYEETVPLNQVRSVSFKGNVWVQGKGEKRTFHIRSYPLALVGVPTKAFRLRKTAWTAQVNLSETMPVSELKKMQKIINNKEKFQMLSEIRFDSPQKMTIYYFSIPKISKN